jgi:thiol-disulfide isomerase/thioredoxin
MLSARNRSTDEAALTLNRTTEALMRRRTFLVGIVPFAAATLGLQSGRADPGILLPALPADPSLWINSRPQGREQLAGSPVLLEFWTFGCSNCRNTLPWMKSIARRYLPDGLHIVAVHTPELAFERDPAAVREAVTRLGITYPVLLDADYAVWTALGNRYWPAFYLFDRRHALADSRIGELHQGQPRADGFETHIARLASVG